ncbi:MAG: methyltransferase domain-containing protein [Rhodospirillales bacterium]
MGITLNIVALFHQLAQTGAIQGAGKVMELGAQDIKCSGQEQAISRTIEAFGHTVPGNDSLKAMASGRSDRFYKALGFEYACVDAGRYPGAVNLDLNFDDVPADHVNGYDLVTNFGTTEHVYDHARAFKVLHDFTAPGGLMLSCVPFTGIIDHGMVNYQPNFFQALARHNGYEVLGLWVAVSTRPKNTLHHMIPWDETLLDAITLKNGAYLNVVALMRKSHNTPFITPFQTVYESVCVDIIAARYPYVIDGDLVNGERVYALRRLEHHTGRELFRELFGKRLPAKLKRLIGRG